MRRMHAHTTQVRIPGRPKKQKLCQNNSKGRNLKLVFVLAGFSFVFDLEERQTNSAQQGIMQIHPSNDPSIPLPGESEVM